MHGTLVKHCASMAVLLVYQSKQNHQVWARAIKSYEKICKAN